MVLGGLANTIVRDGGIRGIVIQPDKALSKIDALNETDLYVEAGALNGSVAAAALKAGIGGLEFLSGIPGKMGGALAMNAGAYGAEVKDVLVQLTGLEPEGAARVFRPEDINMSYRHTELPDGVILTSCILRGVPEPYETIKSRLTDIKEKRNATQPIREKTGGSTFANPAPEELAKAGLPEGTRAWKVVELVGGRGLRVGGAMMSEQHCNFMINTGTASAADLEALGEELIRRARDQFGLELRWEIKRVGSA
jgi:UDP-N-acetylmuramate dehydrogenase